MAFAPIRAAYRRKMHMRGRKKSRLPSLTETKTNSPFRGLLPGRPTSPPVFYFHFLTVERALHEGDLA